MARRTDKSEQAFEKASRVLVGGVNSPVRAFRAVGGVPPVICKGKGCTLTDVDNNSYVDYVCSYGPLILGHADESVVTAINKAVQRGTSYGAPTELETRLAAAVTRAVNADKVRFVSSGTEAAMTAVRLARGATGRGKIIKFTGCYHGHTDSLLVSAGSGATTLGIPSSPGVPSGATADTILLPYNDIEAVTAAFAENPGQIAAVLLEPIAGNMGVIPPVEGYLQQLRTLCDEQESLLVFDEVMTGFRVAYGGAQSLFDVKPDLTVFGKIIGGGMPVGAVTGPDEIMGRLAPLGPIYQAGTLSGNPAAMAAGLATLQALQADDFYDKLEKTSAAIEAGLRDAAESEGLTDKVQIHRVGSMMCVFFTDAKVRSYEEASECNTDAFAAWFHAMLDQGIYFPPSQFESFFVSSAHDDGAVAETVQAARSAFAAASEHMD
ncbi:MAG: glutamate-1-semialdehyde 2,1-aminomutase [Phycisphaerae bacterium]